MDKALRTIPFRTIGQSIPTSQQGTNTTNRGRTNGRCTRNNTHCTHRCNISTQEDFYREHSSSSCTQENNGVSHRRYQHAHRIDDTVLPNNAIISATHPLQDDPLHNNKRNTQSSYPHQTGTLEQLQRALQSRQLSYKMTLTS